MIDKGSFEIEFVHQLGKRIDFLVGRMPERQGAVIVRDHPDRLLVLGLQPSLLVERVVAVLQCLFPWQRVRMRLGISRRVPTSNFAAHNEVGVGMIGECQPEGRNASLDLARYLLAAWRLAITTERISAPGFDGGDTGFV